MKKSNTAERLKQLMKERNYRQVDILQKCEPYCKTYGIKLGRNDLSQYVNGKVEPKQDKLSILGLALNVNEAWLMGFDVSMNRKKTDAEGADEDILLLEKMSLLTERDKKIVMNIIDSFLKNGD